MQALDPSFFVPGYARERAQQQEERRIQAAQRKAEQAAQKAERDRVAAVRKEQQEEIKRYDTARTFNKY